MKAELTTLVVPETRADLWLGRICWAVVALSCLQILLFGFGRDQGIYAAVADAVLAGKMPYRDAWDFKPPGIFLVFALAQALFGKTMASVRLVEVLGLLGMVLAFRRLGRTLFGSATAGLLGGALAVLIHAQLEFWHTAQPESFGGMVTVFALALATGPAVARDGTSRRRVLAWAGVGALFGVAFLMKPPLGGGALVCAAYLAIMETARSRRLTRAALPVLVAGVASLLPIALCALWFWWRGAMPALRWTLFEFTPGYTKLGWTGTPRGFFIYAFHESLVGFSYLLPVAVALAVLLPRVGAREREGMLVVLGLVSMQVAGIALQAKFFQYHYGATELLLSFVAGLGLYKSWRWARRVPFVGVGIYAAAVVWLILSREALRHNPGTFWERSRDRMDFVLFRTTTREVLDAKLYHVADYDLDVDRRAGREVRRLTGPGDSIFVWGFEPSVYWFSGRRAGSRYLYSVPQRATWQRERARAELYADLLESRPSMLVVQHGDIFRFVTGDDLDSFAVIETFPELRGFIASQYRFVEAVDDLDLYRRL